MTETKKLKSNTLRDWIMPDGKKGNSVSRLNVYGRDGLACKRCKGSPEHIIVGGRGTHVCIECQRFMA